MSHPNTALPEVSGTIGFIFGFKEGPRNFSGRETTLVWLTLRGYYRYIRLCRWRDLRSERESSRLLMTPAHRYKMAYRRPGASGFYYITEQIVRIPTCTELHIPYIPRTHTILTNKIPAFRSSKRVARHSATIRLHGLTRQRYWKQCNGFSLSILTQVRCSSRPLPQGIQDTVRKANCNYALFREQSFGIITNRSICERDVSQTPSFRLRRYAIYIEVLPKLQAGRT